MGRGPMPRDVLVSKALSKLLRHGAEKEGLQLHAGGYINLKDVLTNRNIRSLKATFPEVQDIVSSNDKQRFSLIHKSALPSTDDQATSTTSETPSSSLDQQPPSENPADYFIRANQGHSIKVASEDLLTPITEENVPELAVHGTTHAAWPLIVQTGGLKPMGRTQVHFATGLPAGFKSIVETDDAETTKDQAPVVSGMRKSSSVLVFLDVKKAMHAGVKFWLSENGVVLSEGDEKGLVGLQFFSRVEDRTGGQGVLVQDGVVVKEAPESWASKGTGKKSGGA